MNCVHTDKNIFLKSFNGCMSKGNVNYFHRMLTPTGYIPVGLTPNPKFQHFFLAQILGNYHQSFKDRPLVHNRLKLQRTSTNPLFPWLAFEEIGSYK